MERYTVTDDSLSPTDSNGGFFSDNLRSSAVLVSSAFTNDKLKPDDNEYPEFPPPHTPGHAPPPQDVGGGSTWFKKLRTRSVILIILGCILVIGLAVGIGAAIILTQSEFTSSPTTVFPSTSSSSSSTPSSTTTSSSVYISYEGSLKLAEPWEGTQEDLSANFSSDMGVLMKNTSLEDSYLSSNVRGLSEERVQVAFTLFFTPTLYDVVTTSRPDVGDDVYGRFIESTMRDQLVVKATTLNIEQDTIVIVDHIPSTTIPSSASTTQESSTTSTAAERTSASTTSASSTPVTPSTSSSSTSTVAKTSTSAEAIVSTTSKPPPVCRPLEFEPCRSVGYRSTFWRNMFGHEDEDSAIYMFGAMVNETLEAECSPLTLFFFCGLYFPECDLEHDFLYPCPDVCQAVNRDCPNNTHSFACDFFDNGKPCIPVPDHLTTTTVATTTTEATNTTEKANYTCSLLPVEKCRAAGYNVTYLPNMLYDTTMMAAIDNFQLLPEELLNSACSDLLTFYYCGLYFPECSDSEQPLYPCKDVCQEIERACGSSFAIFGCDFHDSYPVCNPAPSTTTTSTTTVPTTTVPTTTSKPYTCEPLAYELCNKLGFNTTYMPNEFYDDTTQAAIASFEMIPPDILHAQCSPLTEFYFCGLWLPECSAQGLRLHPCRSVCEEITKNCTTAVALFDCSQPMFSDDNCLMPPDDLPPRTTTTSTPATTTPPTTTTRKPQCTEMTFETCSTLGYNRTKFPNVFNDNSMDSVMGTFQYFASLSLDNNCSAIALEFFCGLLLPKCEETADFTVQLPCKDFCEDVIGDCADFLPFPMDCSFLTSDPALCVAAPVTPTPQPPTAQCVNQTYEYCREEGFNRTYLPNWFADTLSDTVTSFDKYAMATIENGCSASAKFFYCGMFFPQCEDEGNVTLPCRSLCQEMQEKCGEVWSFPIDCRIFPVDTETCLLPPPPPTTTTVAPPTTTPKPARCEELQYDLCKTFGYNTTHLPNLWSQEDQTNAFRAYENFGERAVALGCSANALFYLCSVIFPPCEDGSFRKPCLDICQEVNSMCGTGKSPADLFHQDCALLSDSSPTCLARPAKVVCNTDEFSCFGSNKCVKKSVVCDKRNDCGDWSDERNCSACNEFEYRCEMGYCIASYQRCDRHIDCPDVSDELNCTCYNGQYTCPDNTCIMPEWVCDGENDCPGGHDEANCGSCLVGSEFACLSGECLPLSQHCDGVPQCKDHSDESQCIFGPAGDNPFMLKFENQGPLPVCSESFNNTLADKACQKLGHLDHKEWSTVKYDNFAYAHLDGVGSATTVLGLATIKDTCQDSETVVLKCNPRECGHPKAHMVSFIVNGNNAIRGAWPWQASIQRLGKHYCGGSLIDHNFVVTAAHCVEAYQLDFQFLEVVLGATNVTANEAGQKRFKVKSLTIHDHIYHVKNDLALIELAEPVTYTDYIKPICLPEKGDVFTRTSQCYAAGWGMTAGDGPAATWLQEAKMSMWNTAKCNSSHAWNGVISETHFCAGYYSGLISICVGDSGGPLMCQTNDNTWKLVGVSSYVAKGCSVPARPSVFSDIPVFTDWIKEKTECKFKCGNGKCIYDKAMLCDRKDDCGDNSDEIDLCEISVNCTFKDKFICGYDSDWSFRPESDYPNHYPLFDHTSGGYPGHFMMAKNRGRLLTSPKFTIHETNCASFYYHTRGPVQGGFQVWTHIFNPPHPEDWLQVFKRSHYNGQDRWIRGEITLTPSTYELVFMSNENARVAVDDISVVPGTCADNGCPSSELSCPSGPTTQCIKAESICNLVADCDAGEDEANCNGPSFLCDFENGQVCGFRQDASDDGQAEWKMRNGSVNDRDVYDHTFGNASGMMLFLDTDYLLENNKVRMRQNVVLHQSQSCLKFYYYSDTTGSFKMTYTRNGSSVTHPLWEFDNRRTHGWTKTHVTIPTPGSVLLDYTMIGGVFGGTYKPFLALDDIRITEGACDTFECDSGLIPCVGENYCLPNSSFCDRVVDCNDASDEAGCECTDEEFNCPDGPCIDKSLQCDRKRDCLDGSDEGDQCDHLVSLSCDFENLYLCGYTFNTSVYKWAWHKGETTTHGTGPATDHTFGNKSGHYIYADGTDGVYSDIAGMESPSMQSNGSGLSFFYQIFSMYHQFYTHLGKLTVLARDNVNNVQTELFNASADGNEDWKAACVNLPVSNNLTVVFVAQRGNRTQADVVVDDIKLMATTCMPDGETVIPGTTPPEITAPPGECKANERKCANTLCAPAKYFCDGVPGDCSDNSDELNCPPGTGR